MGGIDAGSRLTLQTPEVNIANDTPLVPRTAAISRRRQSIKPQVAVKSIYDRPAADYDSWRRRR
jgi:hypothetical protein